MPEDAAPKPPRLGSLDAYRGLVMLLMLGEVLQLPRVAKALGGGGFWGFLAWHQSHVAWVGCSLHDLIQPSFSFLVGAALPFSLAARAAKGQTDRALVAHAAWRAFLLCALGIFLRSIGHPETRFTFDDTLTQIGLGYLPLVLIGMRRPRVHVAALAAILVGYWAAFALYPAPGPDFDWKAVGVPKDWPHLTGFAAHWDKNSNLAWAFDTWWMNLFPRKTPFTHSGGGYATLSFIPTLATMLLGLLAGSLLKSDRPSLDKFKLLMYGGMAAWGVGQLLGVLGICPVVKRIWTPSWVLVSGGWCLGFTALFYWRVDIADQKRWVFPLIVVGTNSIAAYCMEWLFVGFIRSSLRTHLPSGLFTLFGAPYEPLVEGVLILAALWLLLFWMYRRKLFLKI